ncbi:hypothetical protein DFH09DRAFT_1333151 [Mycena vulgaris]|nr:hypothetical protein DFH09DRAFT_1333151 [Mycena vulgaris]
MRVTPPPTCARSYRWKSNKKRPREDDTAQRPARIRRSRTHAPYTRSHAQNDTNSNQAPPLSVFSELMQPELGAPPIQQPFGAAALPTYNADPGRLPVYHSYGLSASSDSWYTAERSEGNHGESAADSKAAVNAFASGLDFGAGDMASAGLDGIGMSGDALGIWTPMGFEAPTSQYPSHSPSEEMDLDAESESDCDSDSSVLNSDGDFEFEDNDEWFQFDEEDEKSEYFSREEMVRRLEEMLGPAEHAELWDIQQSHASRPMDDPADFFCYLPIIPRLQNPKKLEQLLYRHNYKYIPGKSPTAKSCRFKGVQHNQGAPSYIASWTSQMVQKVASTHIKRTSTRQPNCELTAISTSPKSQLVGGPHTNLVYTGRQTEHNGELSSDLRAPTPAVYLCFNPVPTA